LCGAAHELLRNETDTYPLDGLIDRYETTASLRTRMSDLTDQIESWNDELKVFWSTQDMNLLWDTVGSGYPPDHPLINFSARSMLVYPNSWVASTSLYHKAAQILLHEANIALTKTIVPDINDSPSNEDNFKPIQQERKVINDLSTLIIRSLPSLIGFPGQPASKVHEGVATRSCLMLFALDVVAKSEHTCQKHRSIAVKVIRWIRANHAI
jgi:hypothetical protein